MAKKAKSYSVEFKARVAVDAIKDDLTTNQISSKYGIHANQVYHWKNKL